MDCEVIYCNGPATITCVQFTISVDSLMVHFYYYKQLVASIVERTSKSTCFFFKKIVMCFWSKFGTVKLFTERVNGNC